MTARVIFELYYSNFLSCSSTISHVIYCAGKPIVVIVYCLSKSDFYAWPLIRFIFPLLSIGIKVGYWEVITDWKLLRFLSCHCTFLRARCFKSEMKFRNFFFIEVFGRTMVNQNYSIHSPIWRMYILLRTSKCESCLFSWLGKIRLFRS